MVSNPRIKVVSNEFRNMMSNPRIELGSGEVHSTATNPRIELGSNEVCYNGVESENRTRAKRGL